MRIGHGSHTVSKSFLAKSRGSKRKALGVLQALRFYVSVYSLFVPQAILVNTSMKIGR